MNDVPIHSPEQSIRADGGSHQQVVKFDWPPLPGWVIPTAIGCAVLLGFSLAINCYAIYELRTVRTQLWLNDYDMQQLKGNQLAKLQSAIDLDTKLTQAYGLNLTVKRTLENAHGRRNHHSAE